MNYIEFAPPLRRHIDCPPQTVAPLTLHSALEQDLV